MLRRRWGCSSSASPPCRGRRRQSAPFSFSRSLRGTPSSQQGALSGAHWPATNTNSPRSMVRLHPTEHRRAPCEYFITCSSTRMGLCEALRSKRPSGECGRNALDTPLSYPMCVSLRQTHKRAQNCGLLTRPHRPLAFERVGSPRQPRLYSSRSTCSPSTGGAVRSPGGLRELSIGSAQHRHTKPPHQPPSPDEGLHEGAVRLGLVALAPRGRRPPGQAQGSVSGSWVAAYPGTVNSTG